MDAFIVLPPLVQLNTAYPSGAYLKSFFKTQNLDARWFDLSIELFNEIFCRRGLECLFEKCTDIALKKYDEALKNGDSGSAQALLRYVSESSRWIDWIDSIVAILRDGNPSGDNPDCRTSGRELCHGFVFSPFAPRGMRMENFLSNLDHEPTTDDARFLASLALADLADFIAVVFDSEFSLVRYAESLAISETSFAQIEKGLDSPVLKTFYEKTLQRFFATREFTEELSNSFDSGKKVLICISVPFAGTFTAALYTARFFRQHYGDKVFISIGGGFINTELREISDKKIFDYVDSISYDRGYGSYKALFESGILNQKKECGNGKKILNQLYKMRLFDGEKIIAQKESDPGFQKFEETVTAEIVPDFSDIDFSKYPRMIDDTNPMQRLWSDGSWLKVYLAHGCYWHKCDFCDVTLDYVSGYRQTKIEKLYRGLLEQAQKKKIWGIHFVDEAMPISALTKFSLLNSASENRFSFWGNIRFEKNFSYDLVSLFSYSGLVGVSGGIEIATGSGLDGIHKGTDIDSIVGACCAFKENGVLVHAYMIYGYWNQSDQDTINSMETLRQMYAAELLDSSFWHKFVLTRHSRIYSEWEKGMHPDLKPIEPKGAGVFAKNGLHFQGEDRSEKFSDGLNRALQAWMHGESLNKKVNRWFDFKTPEPTVKSDYIEESIRRYEKKKERDFSAPIDISRLYWLCGPINPVDGGKNFCWLYMQDLCREKNILKNVSVRDFQNALYALGTKNRNVSLMKNLAEKNQCVVDFLKNLRGAGLAMV